MVRLDGTESEMLTLEFYRRDDLNCHNGFQDDRLGLVESLPECTQSGEPKSEFGGILYVRSSVLQDESTTVDRVTGKESTAESLVESLKR